MERETQEYRWPDPLQGPYRLRLWFGRVDGRPHVLGAEMWGVTPEMRPWPEVVDPELGERMGWSPLRDAGITAEAVRLPIRKMLQSWVQKNRAFARAAQRSGADPAAVAAFVEGLGPAPRGRPPLSDELLGVVAHVYVDACEAARYDPAKATGIHLAKVLGREVKPSTVRRWIALARSRGFLPAAPPRKSKMRAARVTEREGGDQ
ncbi:MAG TPA: hypothetical protein VMV09_10290 [Candidatus Saccharimonadales bacterium]|nr:hypothetical protein [Candidatus Saccharimonadales bacterium]